MATIGLANCSFVGRHLLFFYWLNFPFRCNYYPPSSILHAKTKHEKAQIHVKYFDIETKTAIQLSV